MRNLLQRDGLPPSEFRNYHPSRLIVRIGLAVIALVVLAALVGVLGYGPLSRATAGDPNGPLWIEYPRWARARSQTELRIHLGAGATGADQARIWLSRGLANDIQLQRIVPQPQRVETDADRTVYVFELLEPQRPTTIKLFFKVDHIGSLAANVGLLDGPSLSFTPLFFP